MKIKLDLTNLKAGIWDEPQGREYLLRVQWAVQRIRSIDNEVSAIYVRFEERMNDGYIFNRDEEGKSRSWLLEATILALGKPRVLPEDLVNIATMVSRERHVLRFMASAERAESLQDVRLTPHFGWLNAEA